jgi:hypothetical protein
LSEGRLQMQAAEATGKTNSGCEAEPPLRFHHHREFFLSMTGKTVSRVARNFIFSPIPAPFYRLRSAREVGVNNNDGVTGFIIHVSSGHFV